MTIHIFNPEHDIALASNLENFTSPHAGRQLRHDLGFLPMLWAEVGDYVLVNDKESSLDSLRRLCLPTEANLIEPQDLEAILRNSQEVNIKPWGWDTALRHEMKRLGVEALNLPTNAWLNTTRLISHRAWASTNLLPVLREINGTVGESRELKSVDEIKKYLGETHEIVLKAPWSSSGRGIRYISDNKEVSDSNSSTYYGLTPQLIGWVNNVIRRQGSIMCEPYYNKVYDFGMEFYSRGNGIVDYCGLSVFQTSNGSYTGNLLDDEAHKQAVICRYLPQELLNAATERIKTTMSSALSGTYTGPFGVDMMVVKSDGKLMLHPCVELNLRMTMGHVAILLASRHKMEEKAMRIIYRDGRYRLSIQLV